MKHKNAKQYCFSLIAFSMSISISVSVYLYIYKLKEIEHGDKYQTLVSFGRKRKALFS